MAGLLLALIHIPIVKQPFTRRSHFFYLGFIGLMVGVATLIINTSRLVAYLAFAAAIFGFITYYIAYRSRFRDPAPGNPN
jgi:protein-S-isoprenylcysteine O-methyltransferase Ste14